MNGILLFILGCFLGGFLGVTMMCLLQIRLNHYEMKDKEEKTADEEKL